MRIAALGILLGAIGLVACAIEPVVTIPADTSGRYNDCERAADLYCSDAIGATGGEREKCVAQYTYTCVSGGAS